MDHDYFNNLSFPCPKEAPLENWATLAQRLQRSCLKFSTIFPHKCMGQYRCIGKQTWPRRKKVKVNMTIILATLVDLPSPMICAKIEPQGSIGSGEKGFKGFYHIWAWRPSYSMDCDHFKYLSFPKPKEAPYEIWPKLAQQLLQRRCHLKMLTDGHTDGQTTDKKWSL